MSQSPCERMKVELWIEIFEEVVEENHRPSVVLPLLLVCKAWQAAGQCLLFRHLFFSGASKVNLLHHQLVGDTIHGRRPCDATRSIGLGQGRAYDTIWHIIPTILLYTINLRAFNATGVPIRSSTLEVLASVAAKSLEVLNVSFCSTECDGGIKLALLSRFVVLRRLTFAAPWDADCATFPISCASGMSMHFLIYLKFSVPDFDPLPDLVVFLSRCHFPSLTDLHLDIPRLGVDKWGDPTDNVLRLEPFFKAVGPQLHVLGLNSPEAAAAPEQLFRHLTVLRQLQFPAGVPPNAVVAYLPVTVTVVGLDIITDTSTDSSDIARILLFLEELSMMESPRHLLSEVRLNSRNGPSFDWTTISTHNPTLAGELMQRSIRLAPWGIQLQDCNGKRLVLMD
ncbi:hypothetical protein CALVIDRAFT_134483 [Calocera viscosa TUFC12733]|uniref:F-box domain-containing protein n=1 Tax=Calocera viscosa (strain TUFC12733) TaxID=1330018 RepID=A0A167LX86_CALVF|nr:hypothetical protein CALVIDRAFT_134483 [Calocera viscosa TUFC12733]